LCERATGAKQNQQNGETKPRHDGIGLGR
jgi:hypothetical protein